jgi:AraC-like DNA-binding protein
MARYTRALLEPAPDATGPLSERIRRLIVLLLPRGYCRIEVVAQQLGIDRRTVARALAAERTTFKRLVDELRCELLRRYRTDGSRPLKEVIFRFTQAGSEVSTLLGFSAASAFTRWHRQHFGVTARSHARRAAR